MTAQKLSPLMEQYFGIKSRCKDAILLFRMGDFYETFGDDAVITARDLNITLTSRQKDDGGNKIPLAGIPYHALDSYLSKLVKAGHKVAICDQVEDPKLSKGLVKRELTRIVTPGTVMEASMLDEGSNNYLAAIAPEIDGPLIGLALLDISTGEFLATAVPASRLSSELARFHPSECLIPRSHGELELQCSRNSNEETFRKEIVDDSLFDLHDAVEALKARFKDLDLHDGSDSLLAEPDGDTRASCDSLCIQAAGAILRYISRSHLDACPHITRLRIISNGEFMAIDDVAMRNLEIFKNAFDGSKNGSLLEFLDRCKSPMGSRTLARWLSMPCLDLQMITDRQDAIEELLKGPLLKDELSSASCGIRGLGDMQRLNGRISSGTAQPKDMAAVRACMLRLPSIVDLLKSVQSSKLHEIADRLDHGPLAGALDLLKSAISEDPPAGAKDSGIIKEGFSEELDVLRSVLKDGKGWIARMEKEERQETGIKSLKVGYNNIFGYYIEVTRANLNLVPERYIRKQTLAGAERFITAELKKMEEQVLSAMERSSALEQEIFNQVRSSIAGYSQAIQTVASAVGELDAVLSLAEVAYEGSMAKPTVDHGDELIIRDGRHPVLDRSMRGSFVPNDLHLDGKNNMFMILTGPNMAGKSTFMRQVAQIAIMAQIGSFVPASYCRCGLIDRIFTRVGARDDISSGQSTFMVEMTELSRILKGATSKSLIILDEVGRGTSTFDGLCIAWAISEHISEKIRAKTIFATHYHQLTALSTKIKGIVNFNMAVLEEGESITFLRSVVPGATDKSYGIHVAKLAGLPDSVIRRAWEKLRELERESAESLAAGSEDETSGRRRRQKTAHFTQMIFFDDAKIDSISASRKGVDLKPIDDGSVAALQVREMILQLDIDGMAPIDALLALRDYREILTKGEMKR
jgi:DNA mismatch repair protein MutS